VIVPSEPHQEAMKNASMMLIPQKSVVHVPILIATETTKVALSMMGMAMVDAIHITICRLVLDLDAVVTVAMTDVIAMNLLAIVMIVQVLKVAHSVVVTKEDL
jgi:hypothetical protein